MKKIFTILFSFFIVSGIVAQQKKPVTVKINTPSVQCEMCKKKIEDYLKFEEGIVKSVVDFKQNKTTAIANTGYDADDVKAEKEAYEKLPKCCKKPAL